MALKPAQTSPKRIQTLFQTSNQSTQNLNQIQVPCLSFSQPTHLQAPQITVSQEKHEPSEDPGSGEKDSAGMQRKGNRRGKRTGQKSKC